MTRHWRAQSLTTGTRRTVQPRMFRRGPQASANAQPLFPVSHENPCVSQLSTFSANLSAHEHTKGRTQVSHSVLFVHDGVVADVSLLRTLRTVHAARAALFASDAPVADPLGFVEPPSPLTALLHPPSSICTPLEPPTASGAPSMTTRVSRGSKYVSIGRGEIFLACSLAHLACSARRRRREWRRGWAGRRRRSRARRRAVGARRRHERGRDGVRGHGRGGSGDGAGALLAAMSVRLLGGLRALSAQAPRADAGRAGQGTA